MLTIKEKIIISIKKRKSEYITRSDLFRFGSRASVTKVIRELIDEGILEKTGHGSYRTILSRPVRKPQSRIGQIKKLRVFFYGRHAGDICQCESGEVPVAMGPRPIEFRYSRAYLDSKMPIPVASCLPLQEKAFDPSVSSVFFDNLLPGMSARNRLEKAIHVGQRDIYGLLQAKGRDLVGAIEIFPDIPRMRIQPKPLTELGKLSRKNPAVSTMAYLKTDGILPGETDKIGIHAYPDDSYSTVSDGLSNCIMKRENIKYEGTVDNEFFCLRLARELGFDVPKLNILQFCDTKYLLVWRFDRIETPDGTKPLHQEDLCQLTGTPAFMKYESDGGPGIETCLVALRKIAPDDYITNGTSFLRAVGLNILLGNGDAHAKNYAVLHLTDGIRFAPLYDILCTRIYSGLDTGLAMTIAGRNILEEMTQENIVSLEKLVEGFSFVGDLQNMASRLPAAMERASRYCIRRGVSPQIIGKIKDVVTTNCAMINNLCLE